MKDRVLITGVAGFAGSHLAEYLLSQGYKVSGLILPGDPAENISSFKTKLELHEANLLDEAALKSALEAARPNYIFHLAGISDVKEAQRKPDRTFEVNAIGQINLLEMVKKVELNPAIMVVGSVLEYGRPGKLPITEQTPLNPLEPYATSKVAQDYIAQQYFMSDDLKIVRVRPFNHTGPRRPAGYLCSSFARQIAQIETGAARPIVEVGDPDYRRDLTDVRDMVAAYLLAVKNCTAGGIYNICSGRSITIGEILDILRGFSNRDVTINKNLSLIHI